MRGNKPSLGTAAALAVLVPAWMASADPPREEPPVPSIASLDQQFLTRLVRRTLEQQLADGTPYQVEYVPPSLRDLNCQVVVTLRQHGRVRGVGSGGPAPVATACRDAAVAALVNAARTGAVSTEWLSRIRVDIEAIGEPQPLGFTGSWSDEQAFNEWIEPGLHGVILSAGQAHREFCPSEIVASNIPVYEAVRSLAKELVATTEQMAGLRIARFRTCHWHEPTDGGAEGRVIELQGGLVPVRLEAVTDEALAAAIDRLVGYILYRQLPNGLFAYLYEPSVDRYSDEDNLVRQVGTAWALARHAAVSGSSASAAAAQLTLEHLSGRVTHLPTGDGPSGTNAPTEPSASASHEPEAPPAAFVAGYEGQHKLGITALTVLAMFDHPKHEQFRQVRERLLNGIHEQQISSGLFVTAFPPFRELSSQYYFPGEALLAIAYDYSQQPTQRAIDAFDSAYDYYHDLWEKDPTPPFAVWHIQAFSRMAQNTKRRDHIDFVFEMADWLVDRQYDENNCHRPMLYGGIEANVRARVGVATASYLEGLTDALILARRVGDSERARRYERAVRLAARFVLQLQVRPEEAYYAISPQDTVWGIRTSLSDNRLRIDHCQHALLAWIKTRQVLFSNQP